MVMILLSTTYAIVLFQVVNRRQIVPVYKSLLANHKIPYLKLNVALLVCWVGTFLIPIYFSPSALVLTALSMTGLCGSAALYRSTRRRSKLVKCSLLVANLALFYGLSSSTYSGWWFGVFIVATLATGLATYLSMVSLSSMLDCGLTSSQVVAVRFWLLWLVALFFVVKDGSYTAITPEVLLYTAGIGAVSLIIPIYCMQKSIEKLGAQKTGIYIGLTPIAVVAAEMLLLGDKDSTVVLPAVLLTVLIVGFAVYEQRVSKPADSPAPTLSPTPGHDAPERPVGAAMAGVSRRT